MVAAACGQPPGYWWRTLELSPSARPLQIVKHVTEGGRLPIPEQDQLPDFPGMDDYIGLIKACWEQAPEARPGFNDIVCQLRSAARGVVQAGIGLATASGPHPLLPASGPPWCWRPLVQGPPGEGRGAPRRNQKRQPHITQHALW